MSSEGSDQASFEFAENSSLESGRPRDEDQPQFPHLRNLNPEQVEAVKHFTGPILVLAGAGSGKTRILTRRIAHLVLQHRVRPHNILAVTFTNKACDEMRARLGDLLGSQGEGLWVATFHSAALRILRRHGKLIGYKDNFHVYDQDDSKAVIKQILKDLGIDDKKNPPQLYARIIENCKNHNISVERYRADPRNIKDERLAGEVYELYQRALLAANAMDFTDLLFNVVRLFKKNPEILKLYQLQLQFILIDEFQDTNPIQYLWVRQLTAVNKNLLVVGDEDQSIYRFRGATIANILEFEKDFPSARVVRLEQNYRSTGNILEVANTVIKNNKERKGKNLWTDEGPGEPIGVYAGNDEDDEANFVVQQIKAHQSSGGKLSEIAVFYRTNAQSRALEEWLIRSGIRYKIFGGLKFYDRKEIKDIVAYLRLLVNPDDNQAFLRIVNTPTRGIGPTTVQRLRNFSQQHLVSLGCGAEQLVAGTGERALRAFVDLISALRSKLVFCTLSTIIDSIIQESGYLKQLEDQNSDEARSRIENLKELRAIALSMEKEGESLTEDIQKFLDRVSLSASNDTPIEDAADKLKSSGENEIEDFVSLMTLHLAKGLEYPKVFFTGFEDGLIPHIRSVEEGPSAVEEERRLCYVGLTRAMQCLYLTRAHTRGMFSSGSGFGASGYYRDVSRFAFEMPTSKLRNLGGEFLSRAGTTLGDASFEVEPEYLDTRFGGGSKWTRQKNSEGTSNRKRVAAPRTPQKLGVLGPEWLKVADNVQSQKASKNEVVDSRLYPLAGIGDLVADQSVLHDTFGKGKIISIEAPESEDSKIVIQFEKYPKAKKLLLRRVVLRLDLSE